MAYTKFDDSPPPEAPASKQPPAQAAPSPKASSSKLVSPTAPAPSPSSTKRPRSPSKPNGHTVHYHSSDEEDAAAAKASLIGAGSAVNGHTAHGLNGNSKKRRKKDKSRLKEDAWVDATNVNGTSNGSTLKGKERLKEERIRLTADRMDLPIWSGQKAIQEAVEKHDTVVILGETGSGKTTQVPQFLLNLPSFRESKIVITQPRRVAALSLAARVAAEQGSVLGGRVGYKVRFDSKAGDMTRLLYATDGMLVRELLGDRELSRYGVVIVDEAHERNISTDILLGSLKRIQAVRNTGKPDAEGNVPMPLKVIIMSATLDAERFSDFFHHCPILYVRGRQHPVTILNTLATPDDYQEAAVRAVFQIHVSQPEGDILVFLTGQEDIDNVTQQLKALSNQLPPSQRTLSVLPFMASTSPVDQAKVFAPAALKTRKVILATNVAETSITLPGIKYVVDSGYAKQKNYVSRRGTGIETLSSTRISASAAMQRTGRAGREGPGTCYRLYSKKAYEELSPSPTPEILRTNLAQVVLQLKEIGIEDVLSFPFLDAPNPEFFLEALITLHGLGALGFPPAMPITPLGHRMLKYPLDPFQSRVLLASLDLGCPNEIIDILSLSNESPLFSEPFERREEAAEARKVFTHREGDHLTMLNVLRSYEQLPASDPRIRREWCRERFVNERNLKRAIMARDQLRELVEFEGVADWKVSCGDEEEKVGMALAQGLYTRTAILRDGEYKQIVGGAVVKIHPSSTLHAKRAPTIIFDELVHTTSTYARNVSQIQYAWLAELPYFSQRNAAA